MSTIEEHDRRVAAGLEWALLHSPPMKRTPMRHGTYAGWNQHMKRGTRICRPCRKAQAKYMRSYRKRQRVAASPR